MKILVVDDSIVFRTAIVSSITSEPDFEIARSLANGKLAVDFVKNNPDIDLITMDFEMPMMDGLEALKEIRKFNKKVVIIFFSSITSRGAEKTIEALNAGANDFVAKPEIISNNVDDSLKSIKEELIPKIKAFRDRLNFKKDYISNISNSSNNSNTSNILNSESSSEVMEIKDISRPKLIVLASSTGGPEALGVFFKNLKIKLPVPMLIVQHMPPIFTEKLAEMLSKLSPNVVKEAKESDLLTPGTVYIAPGDYHMVLNKNNTVSLNQNEKVCYVRPSADVLFNSVLENFSGQILTIVLTGMGEDGAMGAKKLSQGGAQVICQDKESSVVWGMPGSTKKLIPEAQLVSIDKLGFLIERLFQ